MRRVVRVSCVALVLAAACLVAGCGQQSADQPAAGAKAQALCPVMDQKINKAIFADHEGKRVYFCCEGCPETFKKDPAKYVKKLEDQGVAIEKTPAKGG